MKTLGQTLSETILCLVHHLYVQHLLNLNIQCLAPKIDLIRTESCAYMYDVMTFPKTWLKSVVQDDTVSIDCFHFPFRYDIPDRVGGGVAVYIRFMLYFVSTINGLGMEKSSELYQTSILPRNLQTPS